jgi:hypothetical protein
LKAEKSNDRAEVKHPEGRYISSEKIQVRVCVEGDEADECRIAPFGDPRNEDPNK